MTGPNGDSFDGFVFPPFIPTASRATPAPPPAPAAAPPTPPVEAPRPVTNEVVDAQPARVTMPWDAETPIVRDADAGRADAEADEDDHEDLPWLEVPAPREPAAPEAETPAFVADDVVPVAESTAAEADEPRAAPAADDAFPDWMAWGATDEADAAREMGNVDPIAGLENLVPMNDATDTRDVAPDEDATLAAFPVEDEPAFDPADLHAPRPEPRHQPAAADADFLAAGFGGGDFLLRALQASQLAPAEEPVRTPVEDTPEIAASTTDDAQAIAPEPDPFTAAAVAEAEAFAPAEPEADVETTPVAATSPGAQPAAVAHGLADAFGEVAGRLEDIARTLRERPDSLLSGGSDDPLALLVTGYVLGYTQGRRS
ncbi:hypothetical protein [Longimicrobium sp.]|jgi:hypothetical protein|uniref:hypothetical protein n=1 Tax=Longimicrobium sp. TaxID=2029185 RepID=UPI002ED7DE84